MACEYHRSSTLEFCSSRFSDNTNVHLQKPSQELPETSSKYNEKKLPRMSETYCLIRYVEVRSCPITTNTPQRVHYTKMEFSKNLPLKHLLPFIRMTAESIQWEFFFARDTSYGVIVSRLTPISANITVDNESIEYAKL